MESATQTARLAATSDAEFAEAAQRQHAHGPWSHTDLLLAMTVDAIERLIYVQIRKAGQDVTPPKPIPRPGVQTAKVRALNPAGVAYLNALRAKGA